MCCTTRIGGSGAASSGKTWLSACGPPVEMPITTHGGTCGRGRHRGRPASPPRCRGRPAPAGAGASRGRRRRPSRAPHPALRRGQHLGDQQVAAGAHLAELVLLRLGQEVDGAQLQRLERHLGPFLRQGADHHHRHLVHGQNRRQRLQARDLRHLDVQRDHVRPQPRGLRHRLAAVARHARPPRSPATSRACPTAAAASAPSRPRSAHAPVRHPTCSLARGSPRYASSETRVPSGGTSRSASPASSTPAAGRTA